MCIRTVSHAKTNKGLQVRNINRTSGMPTELVHNISQDTTPNITQDPDAAAALDIEHVDGGDDVPRIEMDLACGVLDLQARAPISLRSHIVSSTLGHFEAIAFDAAVRVDYKPSVAW